MISEQHREEQLSRAYFDAVTAKAGHLFDPSRLDYGVDGTLRQVEVHGTRRKTSGVMIDVQLKATKNWSFREDQVIYDLEAQTYNDLIDRFNKDHGTPLILVLLCLPKYESDWLITSPDQLILRHCCYWCQLSGEPTDNTSSRRISIPITNQLTPGTIESLLRRAAVGESDFS